MKKRKKRGIFVTLVLPTLLKITFPLIYSLKNDMKPYIDSGFFCRGVWMSSSSSSAKKKQKFKKSHVPGGNFSKKSHAPEHTPNEQYTLFTSNYKTGFTRWDFIKYMITAITFFTHTSYF